MDLISKVFKKIKETIFLLFNFRQKEEEREDIDFSIKKSLDSLKVTVKDIESKRNDFYGVLFLGEKSNDVKVKEEAAKRKTEDLIQTLKKLEDNIKDLEEVVKIKEKVNKVIFKPLRSSQRLAMWITVLTFIIAFVFRFPEYLENFKELFFNSEIAPEFYNNKRLAIIRENMTTTLYPNAINYIKDELEKSKDENVKSQALVYKAAIAMKTGNYDKYNLMNELQLIDDNKDDFIKGEKLLIHAVYNLNTNDFDNCDEFLRKVINNLDDKFIPTHIAQAMYYQIVNFSKRDDIDKKQGLLTASSLKNQLSNQILKIEDDGLVFDHYNADCCTKYELLKRAENAIEIENKIALDKENQIKIDQKSKEMQEKMQHIKIGIYYNRFDKAIANPKVRKRAENIYKELTAAYPELKNIKRAAAVNYGEGYGDDNVFYRDDEHIKEFYKNLPAKIKMTNFTYYKPLADRYPNDDIIIIVTQER